MVAAALALASCSNSELEPLTGYFPEATVVEMSGESGLTSYTAEKDAADRRVFTIDLSDGTTPIHLTLIGNKYFLTANQYTEALDAVAKNGNFVLGKSTVGGKAIKQGYVNVAVLEENETDAGCNNKYSINAVVFLEDGTPFKANWEGYMAFEKDAVLAPQFIYTDTVAQDCTLEDGSTPVTDVESHTLVLNDLSGEFAAQIKLIRSVGTKDLAGTYTVKEYAHEDLSAGNGFDLGVYFGMPAGSFVIGSYYMNEGAIVILEPGATISVTAMGDGVYSFDGDGFSFLAAPEGYVPGGVTVYDMTDTVAQDCTLEDGQTAVTDVESHTLVLKDSEGNVAGQVKLIRSVGTTDLTGTYTVKEYAHEDLSAGNGFDLGAMFGMDPGSFVIGSYYYGEEGALVLVQPGETITVSIDGDVYTFEGSTDWVLKGKLAEETPGPGPQTGDEVTLSEFLSLTDYSGYGMNMVGIELGTAGFSYQAPDWQTTFTPTYSVDGQFIKLELYAEGGVIAPGTYVPSAENGKVNAGEFNLGAEGWGGSFNGTSWYTVASGVATGVAVTDGTVTVTEAAGVYTIVIETTAVKAKYVGKLGVEAPVELKEFLSITDYSGYGMNMVGVELGTAGFSYQAPDWQTTFTPTYSVDGQFIKLELYAEGGVIAPGTYVPSAENGKVSAGEFNLGAEGWGGSFNGTSWYTVASGAATGVAVTDGTVTVAKEGDVYTIEIKTTAVNAKYVGKLSK